jgi:hypothetical protein
MGQALLVHHPRREARSEDAIGALALQEGPDRFGERCPFGPSARNVPRGQEHETRQGSDGRLVHHVSGRPVAIIALGSAQVGSACSTRFGGGGWSAARVATSASDNSGDRGTPSR